MKFIIFLRNGLGNKLFTLFNGLCFAKYHDIEPIIYSVASHHEKKKNHMNYLYLQIKKFFT